MATIAVSPLEASRAVRAFLTFKAERQAQEALMASLTKIHGYNAVADNLKEMVQIFQEAERSEIAESVASHNALYMLPEQIRSMTLVHREIANVVTITIESEKKKDIEHALGEGHEAIVEDYIPDVTDVYKEMYDVKNAKYVDSHSLNQYLAKLGFTYQGYHADKEGFKHVFFDCALNQKVICPAKDCSPLAALLAFKPLNCPAAVADLIDPEGVCKIDIPQEALPTEHKPDAPPDYTPYTEQLQASREFRHATRKKNAFKAHMACDMSSYGTSFKFKPIFSYLQSEFKMNSNSKTLMIGTGRLFNTGMGRHCPALAPTHYDPLADTTRFPKTHTVHPRCFADDDTDFEFIICDAAIGDDDHMDDSYTCEFSENLIALISKRKQSCVLVTKLHIIKLDKYKSVKAFFGRGHNHEVFLVMQFKEGEAQGLYFSNNTIEQVLKKKSKCDIARNLAILYNVPIVADYQEEELKPLYIAGSRRPDIIQQPKPFRHDRNVVNNRNTIADLAEKLMVFKVKLPTTDPRMQVIEAIQKLAVLAPELKASDYAPNSSKLIQMLTSRNYRNKIDNINHSENANQTQRKVARVNLDKMRKEDMKILICKTVRNTLDLRRNTYEDVRKRLRFAQTYLDGKASVPDLGSVNDPAHTNLLA